MDLRRREGRLIQGQRIQAAADEAGLSLTELARRIGCSRALIYQYLAGQVLAQPDRLQDIADVCGKPLAWFYGADDDAAAGAAALGRERAELEAQRLGLERTRAVDLVDYLTELAAAQAAGPNFAALRRTCERLVERVRDLGDARRLAEAEFQLGGACWALGEFEAARVALARAVDGFRALGAADRERAARQTLGGSLAALGERDLALAEFDAVLAGGTSADIWRGRLGRADVFESLGRGLEALDELAAAAAALEGTDSDERALADLYITAATVNVYLLCDDFRLAAEAARRCAVAAEELAEVGQLIEARLNLGWAERYLGRQPAAHTAFEDALRLARLTGDRERHAVALACLAELLAALGRHDEARAAGKDALAAALAQGSVRAEVLAHRALAETYRRGGQPREAEYHVRCGLAAAGAHRLTKLELLLRLIGVALKRSAGDHAGAAAEARRALAVAEAIGARAAQAEALLATGEAEAATQAAELAAETGAFELGLAVDLARSRATGDPDWAFAAARRLLDLRDAATAAGLEAPLLEDPERLTLVRESISLLTIAGRTDEAAALRERAAWPPLDEAGDDPRGE